MTSLINIQVLEKPVSSNLRGRTFGAICCRHLQQRDSRFSITTVLAVAAQESLRASRTIQHYSEYMKKRDGVDVGLHGILDRIRLAQVMKQWRDHENTEMDLRVSLRVGYN